jgi:cation transport ATPase
MAQMKSKRKTKHRGNAAGVVEVRGRTGRPPSPQERKRQAREARQRKPPTWKSAMQRAALAGVIMFVVLYLVDAHTKRGGNRLLAALIFAVLAVAIYTPGVYYFERSLYRRRMAKLKP